MYEYLKGIITKITAKYIVLETNGIGYILHVANPYAYSGQVNQEAQIYVIPALSISFTIVAPQRVQVPQVEVKITASTPSATNF